MSKYKVGLQKQVSTIFNGVPIPKAGGVRHYADSQLIERSDNAPASHPTSRTGTPQQLVQSASQAPRFKAAKANVAKISSAQTALKQTWEKIQNKLFASKQGVGNTRQKVMVILVPALLIVLIAVLIRVFATTPHKAALQAKTVPTTAAVSVDKINWQKPEPYPTTLRDPMQMGSVTITTAGTPELIVSSIVYSEDKPSAVVGSRIVHQGDKVPGATIVKISQDSVEFEANGKRWTQKVRTR